MSRQSLVRDAVVAELKTRISGYPIESFIVPHYRREDLEAGPRICVRSGARELRVDQGPDGRDVMIEVGVIGITKERKEIDEESYRNAIVADADLFDGVMETLIALWTPNGPLSRVGLAEHRFVGIDQAINFDAAKLYNDGIWLSMIQLTYQDTVDE
jgi:hypothetical protein